MNGGIGKRFGEKELQNVNEMYLEELECGNGLGE